MRFLYWGRHAGRALLLAALVFAVSLGTRAQSEEEQAILPPGLVIPETSQACVTCHSQQTPGVISHWGKSRHSAAGVGCIECHGARKEDADAFDHYGSSIAVIVTPRDCSACHQKEYAQFEASHHSQAGNILASLDNLLAESAEGNRTPFNPHAPTPGLLDQGLVNGMASASSGCKQCHGAKVGLLTTDGQTITVDDLKPDDDGLPTNPALLANLKRDDQGRPLLDSATWPNTGIGRLNLDGSKGSCSACHSRHDFSPRRARQPENCGKCHLGPDHPQEEIYDESKHGIAFRDLIDEENLNAREWVLGKDYYAAPTCASCHMSGNLRNGGEVTHDPGERISWTNRPAVSKLLDTDAKHNLVTETDPEKRKALIADTWQQKRARMKDACLTCHTPNYVDNFYQQYDNLVILYNEKFGKPGLAIMDKLHADGLLTKSDFDEDVEWSWYLIWHHQGRRARHGAAMMAPDYTHWHGMFEVAQEWYTQFIPQVRATIAKARAAGKTAEADDCEKLVNEIMARPEHAWYVAGNEAQAEEIRKAMEQRYGK